MKPSAAPIVSGAVAIRNNAILSAGPAANILRRFSGHRVQRLRNAVLMPGLINLHTHLELPPLLDRVQAKTFPDWIIHLIQAKKDLRKQDYQSATRKNINTLIQTGTTSVGEICTHGISPALLKQSGLRGIIFNEIISMDPLSDFPRLSSLVSHPSSLIQTGLSPHSPYTASQTALRKISRLSQNKGTRIAMHIAESREEIQLLQRKKSGLEKLYGFAGWDLSRAPRGDSSVEYLKRIGFLSSRLLAVHAVQVTEKDIKLIRKANVSIAHCPRSNKETGVGKMPLKKFLDAGVTVGLGTDSLASSPTLSMWDEMRFAYRMHRRDGVSAEDIFRLATIGGAKALGMDKDIGSLEPGRKADLIAVPLPSRNTGNLYSDLLRETKSCIMTMVNGKILYHDPGRLT